MSWTIVAQLSGLVLVISFGARYVVEGIPRKTVIHHEKAPDQ